MKPALCSKHFDQERDKTPDKSNMKRIFIAILIILSILSVISLVSQGNPWLPLLAILSATVGVPVAISHPFPLETKILFIVGLLLSAIAMIYGFKKRNLLIGQIIAILGLVCWSFIGLMGLGQLM